MNDKEFASIVNSTKGVVLAAIRKHLAAEYLHSIDDVVQETYIRAYRSLVKNSFRGDSSINTWIYTIARNESLRMMKKLNREEIKLRKKAEKMEELAVNEAVEYTAGYNDRIDVDNSISSLPDKYKKVMELIFLGFSEKQIASELSLKKGTVKSRVFRGRALLQKMVSGESKYVN